MRNSSLFRHDETWKKHCIKFLRQLGWKKSLKKILSANSFTVAQHGTGFEPLKLTATHMYLEGADLENEVLKKDFKWKHNSAQVTLKSDTRRRHGERRDVNKQK
jgi:hypothetical protein